MTDPTQKESHEAIHRLCDGELDAAGKAALAEKAKLDPRVRARALGVLEVRTLVQAAVEAQTPAIDSNELWAKIEAGLDADGAREKKAENKPGLRAIPGGAASTKGSAETRAPSADPAVRLRRIGATVIGALALAAVAWLVLFPHDAPTVADPELPDAHPASARTEVLEVDFGTNIGTVFSIEGDEGERYAVVWIDEGDLGDGVVGERGAGAPAPTPD